MFVETIEIRSANLDAGVGCRFLVVWDGIFIFRCCRWCWWRRGGNQRWNSKSAFRFIFWRYVTVVFADAVGKNVFVIEFPAEKCALLGVGSREVWLRAYRFRRSDCESFDGFFFLWPSLDRLRLLVDNGSFSDMIVAAALIFSAKTARSCSDVLRCGTDVLKQGCQDETCSFRMIVQSHFFTPAPNMPRGKHVWATPSARIFGPYALWKSGWTVHQDEVLGFALALSLSSCKIKKNL